MSYAVILILFRELLHVFLLAFIIHSSGSWDLEGGERQLGRYVNGVLSKGGFPKFRFPSSQFFAKVWSVCCVLADISVTYTVLTCDGCVRLNGCRVVSRIADMRECAQIHSSSVAVWRKVLKKWTQSGYVLSRLRISFVSCLVILYFSAYWIYSELTRDWCKVI